MVISGTDRLYFLNIPRRPRNVIRMRICDTVRGGARTLSRMNRYEVAALTSTRRISTARESVSAARKRLEGASNMFGKCRKEVSTFYAYSMAYEAQAEIVINIPRVQHMEDALLKE